MARGRESRLTLAPLVGALYRALHPERGAKTGAQAWFRRELHRAGVDVSTTRLHHWLHEQIPEDRRAEVERVLEALHKRAHAKVRAQLDEIRAIPGNFR